ncbi:MAG: beta-galactosidase [Verrucomicrobiae bacterium]|nr:beta-galactosidase [Verrucomicrobiae bacterium]
MKSVFITTVLAACSLILTGCRSIPPLAATDPLPILAWIGPPAEQTTPERYRELAEAGFNISFSGFPNAEKLAQSLEVAHAAGVRLMVSCPELKSDPEATVRRFMGHPAVAGYYLRDEPNVRDFKELGEWVRRIRAVDDTHPCYINLFPTYANTTQLGTPTYREHVERFLAEVPVQVLSFDHYPIVGERLRADWYENLEIIAAAARKARLPFWAFALSVAHNPYPVATVDGLRLQVFSNLAYGAAAIQYFTYWTPVSTQWNFHRAPIESDGTRTEVYDRVRAVNAELQTLAPVFQGAKVLRAEHLGEPLPRGTQRFEPASPVRTLETEGQGAVVSRMRNDTHEFLVVVNRELQRTMDLSIAFEPGAKVCEFTKQGKLRRLKAGQFADQVTPGDIRIFVWSR